MSAFGGKFGSREGAGRVGDEVDEVPRRRLRTHGRVTKRARSINPDVRFWHKADIALLSSNVRFRG